MGLQPYTIEPEYDRQAREAILWINVWEETPSLAWGSIIGDILQNSRQALDHIAWTFAEAGAGGTRATEFPIFRNEAKYYSTDRGGGLYKIAAVTDQEVRAVIESMQPFSGSSR